MGLISQNTGDWTSTFCFKIFIEHSKSVLLRNYISTQIYSYTHHFQIPVLHIKINVQPKFRLIGLGQSKNDTYM